MLNNQGLRATIKLIPLTEYQTGKSVEVFAMETSLLPSGYVKIAIGNDHRNSGFSH